MKRLLGRLMCALTKHRRGKRISSTHVRCQRCGAEWAREQKATA